MSDQLRDLGIRLHEGYDAQQLDQYPADLYVIGNAMTRGKPVIEAILDRGLAYASGPQWLATNVLQDKWVLAVAGTHGKSTTSSMLAWILHEAGLDPGFLIGGIPRNFGISARDTGSRFFVIEADEYDTAFFDKRSKFVWYRPRTAILANLEYDHADIFPDLASIETQFHHFVRIVPSQGLLVANGNDPSIERVLLRGAWTPVQRFGPGREWSTGAVNDDDSFDVLHEGRAQGMVRWDLMGEHNRLNALAAIAAARDAGVAPAVAIEALARFQGVKRRMELRGQVNGITVYDDFAHHPTAFEATIAGLRKARGARAHRRGVRAALQHDEAGDDAGAPRIEPHRRRRGVLLCEGPGLGARRHAGTPGARAFVFHEIEPMVESLAAMLRPGDHVLVMSNGGFGDVHAKLLERLDPARRDAA
jgi:UDP-N-acetylmuramate: L-alanyl-gamma-D-glutamyl-meso-diaminopimelate ligase